MKYMGSKSRIAKYIVPIIQEKMAEHKTTEKGERENEKVADK